MKQFSTIMLLAFAVTLAGCVTPGRDSNNVNDGFAIVGVSVLSMDGSDPVENGVVIVRGDRIAAVGPAGTLFVPAGMRRIDARGKYVVPGLVDMHTHLPPDPGVTGDATWRQLRLMVANGITTARSMSGHPSHPALRDAVIADEAHIAPTLYVASPAIHQGNTPDAATAREKVQAAKRAGFDLVKSHHLEDVGTWRALQSAAREAGIPTAGHLASSIPLADAIRAGQQIEHLDGYFAALLPDGSPAGEIAFGQIPPPPVMQAIDSRRIDDVARRVAQLDGWNVPTLNLFERVANVETPVATLRAAPEMRYVPAVILEQWAARREQLVGMGIMQAVGEEFVRTRRAIVKALNEAGAGLMAGSDTPQEFQLSGFALHDELAALQNAGLSPLHALATATRNPRDYLVSLPNHGSATGRPADFGVLAAGNRADLLLLNADPSRDVRATRDIDSVVLRGRVLDRAALDALLASVAESVARADNTDTGH